MKRFSHDIHESLIKLFTVENLQQAGSKQTPTVDWWLYCVLIWKRGSHLELGENKFTMCIYTGHLGLQSTREFN